MNAVEDHDPLAASSAGYPDAAVSVAFFAAMFGHETTGRMTIWTASNRKTYWPNTTEEAAAAAIGLAGDDDVYFGVGLRRSRLMNGRGSSDEVGSVTAVWADVDIELPDEVGTGTLRVRTGESQVHLELAGELSAVSDAPVADEPTRKLAEPP